jgi:hypothetical protein
MSCARAILLKTDQHQVSFRPYLLQVGNNYNNNANNDDGKVNTSSY